MSRSAIYQALSNNAELNALGITAETIFPGYSLDGTPTRTSPFLILRWGEHGYILPGDVESSRPARGTRTLTIWAHSPREVGSDYYLLDLILKHTKDVLTAMEQVNGDDGYVITCVRATGEGSDLSDPAYNTIMRNSAFEVLFRAA